MVFPPPGIPFLLWLANCISAFKSQLKNLLWEALLTFSERANHFLSSTLSITHTCNSAEVYSLSELLVQTRHCLRPDHKIIQVLVTTLINSHLSGIDRHGNGIILCILMNAVKFIIMHRIIPSLDLMRRTDSFEKTLMLEKIEGGRRRGFRGWDGWMASPTQWTWVWINSRSWWWKRRPSMLQSMGWQRVGHDWATELKWDDCWVELSWIELKITNIYLSAFISGLNGGPPKVCPSPNPQDLWILPMWQELILIYMDLERSLSRIVRECPKCSHICKVSGKRHRKVKEAMCPCWQKLERCNQPKAKCALGLRKEAWPSGQLTLDFWPLESRENECLLF